MNFRSFSAIRCNLILGKESFPLPSGLKNRFQNKYNGKFTLELLFQIIGIGSASGLIYKDNSLLIIGDNSGFLYEYQMDSHDLKRHPLLENQQKTRSKKTKLILKP
jgi:hypothetical protein